MDLKRIGIQISVAVAAIGAAGLIGITVKDFLFPKPPEKELRQTKTVLHSTFEKNKQLNQELSALTQKNVSALKIVEDKDKEIASLQAEIQKQTEFVKELTKRNQIKKDQEETQKKFDKEKITYAPTPDAVKPEAGAPYEDTSLGLKKMINKTVEPKNNPSAKAPKEKAYQKKVEILEKRLSETLQELKRKEEELKTAPKKITASAAPVLEKGSESKPVSDQKPSKVMEENPQPQESADAQNETAEVSSQPSVSIAPVPSPAENNAVMEASGIQSKAKELQEDTADFEKQLQSLDAKVNEIIQSQPPEKKEESKQPEISKKQEIPPPAPEKSQTEESSRIEKTRPEEPPAEPVRLLEKKEETEEIAEKAEEPVNAPVISKAVRAGSKLPKHKAEKVIYYYNLGVAYTQAGLYKKAADIYERAVKLDPKDAPSHYNLGILYEEYLHKVEKAIEHYRAFIANSQNEEKKKIVSDWIRLLRYENPLGDTPLGAAHKAADHLLFATSD